MSELTSLTIMPASRKPFQAYKLSKSCNDWYNDLRDLVETYLQESERRILHVFEADVLSQSYED